MARNRTLVRTAHRRDSNRCSFVAIFRCLEMCVEIYIFNPSKFNIVCTDLVFRVKTVSFVVSTVSTINCISQAILIVLALLSNVQIKDKAHCYQLQSISLQFVYFHSVLIWLFSILFRNYNIKRKTTTHNNLAQIDFNSICHR